MPEQVIVDYAFVLAFLTGAFIFGVVPLIASFFLAPRGGGIRRLISYESGMTPIGSAWIQFGVAYYLYALLFLAFDVDILYLFPVLTAYGAFAWRDLVELVIFVGILALAIIYAWKKGVFEW